MKKILLALLLAFSATAHSQNSAAKESAQDLSYFQDAAKDSVGAQLLQFHKEYSFGATVSACGIAVALAGSSFASGPIILLGTVAYLGGQAIIIDSHKYFKSIGKIIGREKISISPYPTN
jgi:hypothetical protein